MRIAVSGAGGYVGSALLPALAAGDHRVTRMVRGPVSPDPDVVSWDPAAGTIDSASLEGVEAAVHLAGDSLFGLRWTRGRKRRISESRVKGTGLLARTLAGLDHPPRTLIAMSAIGYYGDRPGEVLHEDSPPGAGFLAEVAQAWEQATAPAKLAGIRVVNLRMAPIVGPGSPLLRILGPIFKFGLGGWFGSGRQHWAWVALDDVVGVIVRSIQHDDAEGPLNLVAPEAVTSREFAKTLGRVLRRPVLVPVVSPLARLVAGEIADEMLLPDQRIEPTRLNALGYRFTYPTLEPALRHALDRPSNHQTGQV